MLDAGALDMALPTRRNLTLLLLRREEVQGLCKVQAMLEGRGQPGTHLLSGCLVRVQFKKQFHLRFVLATFVVDGQLYLKLKDLPVGVRPSDCSNKNMLDTPEAFLSSGQAELAEVQSLLAPGEPCLQLERVAATAWAIKVALHWAGQLQTYLSELGLDVLRHDLRDPAKIQEMAGHLDRAPGEALASAAAGADMAEEEQQEQKQKQEKQEQQQPLGQQATWQPSLPQQPAVELAVPPQQLAAEEGAAQGLLSCLSLQRLEERQPAVPDSFDMATQARRHSLQQAAGSGGEPSIPPAAREGQAQQQLSPPLPSEQQQPQLPPLPPLPAEPPPQPSLGGKVSFCLGKNPRLFAKQPHKQGRAGSEVAALPSPSLAAKQQQQLGKPANSISEQELQVARQAVVVAQQQLEGADGTSPQAEQLAAPAAAATTFAWPGAYGAAGNAGDWYGAPAMEYRLPSYAVKGSAVGGHLPAATTLSLGWQGAAVTLYPAAAAGAAAGAAGGGYEDEVPAPRSDVCMRPSNIRPNQATASLCGFLGRCRWGSACYYAHGGAESNRFARWQAELLAAGVNPSLARPGVMYVSAQVPASAQTQQLSTWRQLQGVVDADIDWASVALAEEEVRYFLADLKGLMIRKDPPIRVGRLRAEVPSLGKAFGKLGPLRWFSIQSFCRALQAQGRLAELGLVLREDTQDGTVIDYMEEEGQLELKPGSTASPAAAGASAPAAAAAAHPSTGENRDLAAAGNQDAAGPAAAAAGLCGAGRHDHKAGEGKEDRGCSRGDSGKSSQGVAKPMPVAGLGPDRDCRGRRGRSRSKSRSREKEKRARGRSRGCSHERSRAKRSRSRGRSSPKARTHRSPAGRSQRGSSRGRAERSRGRGQRSNSRVRTQHSRGHSQRSRSRDRSQRRTNRGHSQRRNSRGRSQRSRSKGHSPIKRASFADVWKVANTQLQIPGIGVTVPKRVVTLLVDALGKCSRRVPLGVGEVQLEMEQLDRRFCPAMDLPCDIWRACVELEKTGLLELEGNSGTNMRVTRVAF